MFSSKAVVISLLLTPWILISRLDDGAFCAKAIVAKQKNNNKKINSLTSRFLALIIIHEFSIV